VHHRETMPLAAAALAAALLAAPAAAAAMGEEEIGVGLPAPGFSLKTLNPEVAGLTWLALDRYLGEEAEDPGAKVVLLSFFASWCGPCQKELPFLAQLDGLYRGQGLRVVSISIDKDEAGIAAARTMAAAAKVAFPVLSDRFNFLAKRYLGDEAPLPSVFLVARDGTVLRIERGYSKDAGAFLLAEVQQALGLRTAAAVQPATLARPAAPRK
jgi:thiol-disulfide isomerase/thioredoxin